MAKRRMVQVNLLKNSIAAYFAAVEIHNKPNIQYRYETVTLLFVNAWELALKAYIKKYVKSRSIFTQDGHTITLDKALVLVREHINGIKKNSFTAIAKNIEEIEKYRNGITHFYCDQLEPYIFMLVARSALNYVEFIKRYFGKDIMSDEGLFIMPLGFKLPFKPEDFLSGNVAKYSSSEEARIFIKEIVDVIQSLKNDGVEDSIVLGFDIYFESVKKITNSDILAAISNSAEDAIPFTKLSNFRFSADANATIKISDQQFRQIWKYTHDDVVEWCRSNIPDFKKNAKFNDAKKELWPEKNQQYNQYVYNAKLDINNSKSASKMFYSADALHKLKELLT